MQYSIVPYSKLDSIKLRLDAEYYRTDLLNIEKKIKSICSIKIVDLNIKLGCSAFYPSIVEYYSFNKCGVPFLRVNEIKNGVISITDSTAFIPVDILNENSKTIDLAYPGDILIAKGGNTLGKVSIVDHTYDYYAVCRDIIILKTNFLPAIEVISIWLYFHSKNGQLMILRTASQTGQPHLTTKAIAQLEIPIWKKLNRFFYLLYNMSKNSINDSFLLYRQAEELLLDELGLLHWQPRNKLHFVADFAETETAQRIDADYFQPKYEELLEAIKKSSILKPLSEVCAIKDTNFRPDPDESYTYIELSDIDSMGQIGELPETGGDALPTRARRIVRNGDVIVSSIEGSLDTIAIVDKKHDRALCSTGFYVLSSDKINAPTLFVFMKSIVGQMQLKRGCSGTILTAISKDKLGNVQLPMLSLRHQQIIEDRINMKNALLQKSHQLLSIAQRAVEMAVEEDEQRAEVWIKKQLSSIGVSLKSRKEELADFIAGFPHHFLSKVQLREWVLQAHLDISDETLNSYIKEFKDGGILYSAGRGWYTKTAVKQHIKTDPVQAIANEIEAALPFLNFNCWSTEQFQPYFHHLLGKHLIFVYTSRDAISAVTDFLVDTGYTVLGNPSQRELRNALQKQSVDVVVRPVVEREPDNQTHFSPLEKAVIDFIVENNYGDFCDKMELTSALQKAVKRNYTDVSLFLDYSVRKGDVGVEIVKNPTM